MGVVIFEEFKGTEYMELRVDQQLPDYRPVPTVVVITSSAPK